MSLIYNCSSNICAIVEIGKWLPLWFSGKEFTCQCRRCRFNPWSGRTLGEGNGNLLQYSCLENPMDRGAGRLQSIGLQRVR